MKRAMIALALAFGLASSAVADTDDDRIRTDLIVAYLGAGRWA